MVNESKLLSAEELKREKRKKQLAAIKASNEMLEQAKATVLKTDKIGDVERTERVQEIDKAIWENEQRAKMAYGATKEEMDAITYTEPSEEAKRKYAERLEKRGLTEEQVERMDIATVSTNTKPVESKRKYTVKRKKALKTEKDVDEEIVRLPNEEELMRKSMATQKDIDERKVQLEREMKTSGNNTIEKTIKKQIDSQKVKDNTKVKEVRAEEKVEKTVKKNKTNMVKYSFDASSIPDYVKYDVIPLPSGGKCYPMTSPLRCGRVPVAMLTASDENIIASPNMYRDGKIIDIILERKILDKTIDIQSLVKGDRDAIVLWLRATGYDTDYPIIATHPETGKKYDINVKLNELKYKPFELESDTDGNFTYTALNGDIIKFNFLTQEMENYFKNEIINNNVNIEKFNINKYLYNIEDCLSNTDFEDSDRNDIQGCINDIRDIINENVKDDLDEKRIYSNLITEQMILFTKSINGNTNHDYIVRYIENMRSNDAYKYRNLVNSNKPGVDFEITINVPESDGGGSFSTFLNIGDYVFTNL